MKYHLHEEGNGVHPLATQDLADDFAAERWAKDWAASRDGATDAFRLAREDNRFAMRVFRTKAGQWYMTPVP